LKSRLQKLDGLTYSELKNNIEKTIEKIPKEKYRNILLTEDSIKLFNIAFISNSANVIRKHDGRNYYYTIDENSTENYEVFETLGDTVFKNFIVFYSARRFNIEKAKDLKIIARIKINYGADKEFAKTSGSLGFLNLITASENEYSTKRNKLLEDVFEAFFGVLCYLLDTKIKRGVGFSISYRILKYIYDNKNIPSVFSELLDPVTEVKELFDKNPDLGVVEYTYAIRPDRIVVCELKRKVDGKEYLISTGTGSKYDTAKMDAAEKAMSVLNI
jgi:dsRNA-specific ribonuclease